MPRARHLPLAALLAGALVVGPARAAPSFDCDRASGEVEALICADEGLAALDRELAEVWHDALARWPAEVVELERATQRRWVDERDRCRIADDVRGCVEQRYQHRIVELRIASGAASGALPAPNLTGYRCAGREGERVTVAYYDETEPPAAVVTVGDHQVVAFPAPSASGARYTAPGVELWEHQGEATLDWFGDVYRCAVVAAPFRRTLELDGVGFEVTASNAGPSNTVLVQPTGRADELPVPHRVEGQVVGAELADLDDDRSPEVYVYLRGPDARGSLVGWSAGRGALQEIHLPELPAEARDGYRGHDAFRVEGDALIRRFPVYREGDADAEPSGGTRQLRYGLVPGEAGGRLEVERVLEPRDDGDPRDGDLRNDTTPEP